MAPIAPAWSGGAVPSLSVAHVVRSLAIAGVFTLGLSACGHPDDPTVVASGTPPTSTSTSEGTTSTTVAPIVDATTTSSDVAASPTTVRKATTPTTGATSPTTTVARNREHTTTTLAGPRIRFWTMQGQEFDSAVCPRTFNQISNLKINVTVLPSAGAIFTFSWAPVPGHPGKAGSYPLSHSDFPSPDGYVYYAAELPEYVPSTPYTVTFTISDDHGGHDSKTLETPVHGCQ